MVTGGDYAVAVPNAARTGGQCVSRAVANVVAIARCASERAPVKVHTGIGGNTSNNLYWRSGGYVWNQTGDTATLKNATGNLVDRCSYTSAPDPEAFC
jgi:hypothetical protein